MKNSIIMDAAQVDTLLFTVVATRKSHKNFSPVSQISPTPPPIFAYEFVSSYGFVRNL